MSEDKELVVEDLKAVKRRGRDVGSLDANEFQTELPDRIVLERKKNGEMKQPPTKMTATERRAKKDPRYKDHGWHSDARKMEAACAYAVSGNSRRVSEMLNIPEGTIRAWKTTEWWNDIQTRIRIEGDEELDTKLTKMVNKAVDAINDRLENGDYVYNVHQDKLVRKPIGANEANKIFATSLDKRQLLRGEPTSRSAKVSENEKLVKLAEQFKNFVNAREVESVAQKIEEENDRVVDQDA